MQARDCEPFVPELDGIFIAVYMAKSFSDAVFAILDNQNPPKPEHLSEADEHIILKMLDHMLQNVFANCRYEGL